MGCGASSAAEFDAATTPMNGSKILLAENPSDYTIVGLLGDGALGRVYLCDLPSGQSCALKVMSRHDIEERGIQTKLATEREILLRCVGHPFIAQMIGSFATSSFEYMVMDEYTGTLFDTQKAFLNSRMSEKAARFYLVELLLGVEHVHSLGFVCRDIKPENVLIDHDGHLRLADFDQATRIRKLQSGEKPGWGGTPDYIAPEVIRALHTDDVELGYGIDVWSLGVMLFEFIHGRTPFGRVYTDTTNVYTSILHERPYAQGKVKVKTKAGMKLRRIELSTEYAVLLEHMLVKEPREGRATIAEVRRSPWLSAIDWEAASARALTPASIVDPSKRARTRSRRLSTKRMLNSDSLARKNWQESGRTSLRGVSRGDLLHHSSSHDASLATILSPSPAQAKRALTPIPGALDAKPSAYEYAAPHACELTDPNELFVSAAVEKVHTCKPAPSLEQLQRPDTPELPADEDVDE